MHGLYIAIACLALYGDLIKRFLPSSVSVAVLYGISLAIVISIFFERKVPKCFISPQGALVKFSATALLLLYLMQIFMPSPDFISSLSHALYMGIPLFFFLVFSIRAPDFQLARFAQVFLVMMLPVNAVGLVQNYINPNFFISTAYSENDLGGVILRNLLDDSFFARYPSIFVSADRYSAMGLMQFYFTLLAIRTEQVLSTRSKLWLFFNAVSALAALLIAGARSRILIAFAAVALASLTTVYALVFGKRGAVHGRFNNVWYLLPPVLLLVAWFYVILRPSTDQASESSLPVLTFLSQSTEKGDFGVRILEALEFSVLPDHVGLLGEGLGSIANGKPGEFGIQSMWVESGLFWGMLMLLAFLLMLYALFVVTMRRFLTDRPLEVAISSIPLLLIVFALLAGLTSTFELSTGVLLGCTVPVILRKSISRAVGTGHHPKKGFILRTTHGSK